MQKNVPSLCALLALAAAALAHPDAEQSPAPRDDTKPAAATVMGTGANSFRLVSGWGGVPEKVNLGPTHGGVAVDKRGLIYMSSDGEKAIFVFSSDGTLQRTIAPEFSGIHSLCVHEEGGQEFLYGAHLRGAQMVKLTLDGKAVLTIPYPREANAYPNGQGYKPTAIAVAPDGAIFVADGYGLSLIHKFDAAGKYVKTFGGKGAGDGQFQVCHGLVLDTRYEKPLLLVCDRENGRLQHFDMDGNFVAIAATGLRRPCTGSIRGEMLALAELAGRVVILDKTNKPVAVLGDNPDQSQWAKFDVPAESWKPGIFTAPHGISYDAEGNLYVQDWNKTGRLTKLVKTVN